MPPTTPFKRLILRAVLGNVSPMVIRLVSVSDRTDLLGLHDVFHAILGWSGHPLRSDLWKCVAAEGRFAPSLYSRSVRCDLAKFPIIYPNLGLDYKVATRFLARNIPPILPGSPPAEAKFSSQRGCVLIFLVKQICRDRSEALKERALHLKVR